MGSRLSRRSRSGARERRMAFVRAVGDIDPRLELDAFLQRVADVALAVGARSAVVAVTSEGTWRIVQAGDEVADSAEVAQRIASTGRTWRAAEAAEETRAVFGVPLRSRSGTADALWVVSDEQLSDEEEALISSLGDLVTAAVADATLFASAGEAREKSQRQERAEILFASMVSHELRSPLAAVRGFGRLLLDREEDLSVAERREFLESIVRQSDYMASLVDDVLDVAQIQAGEFRCTIAPFDVRLVLAECVEDAAAAFPDHRVTLEAPASLPAEVDPSRMKQVVLNMLSNACRYSPPGTPVAVRAGGEGNELFIAVADRGPGIAPEDLPGLFERFTRAETPQTARVKGAGLGLFIAKQIVEMHGGRIGAEPNPGGGTVFRITMPLNHHG